MYKKARSKYVTINGKRYKDVTGAVLKDNHGWLSRAPVTDARRLSGKNDKVGILRG